MGNIQTTKNQKVWIDGDTLVRRAGEDEARDYLYGNGYQAQLTKFIKERDRRLQEEARLNTHKKPVKPAHEIEPEA